MTTPFVATQAKLFQPTQISGCSFWLDAADTSTVGRSGTSVTSWTSKGENSTAVSQSSSNPIYTLNVYNSLPTLRFSFGNTLPLSNATVANSVVQNNLSYTIFLVHTPNANNSTPFAYLTGGGSRLSVVTPESSNISYDGISARLSYSYPSQAAYLNGALRMEAFYSLSSTGFYRRDGSQLATGSLGSGSYNATQNLFIGGAVPNYPGYYYGGDICEVVWYNLGLNSSQISLVEGYLAWKWNLVGSLPATHPYKNTPVYSLQPFPLVPQVPKSTSAAVFLPTQISGCQLWLDGTDPNGNGLLPANGATISSWIDKSRSGNTAIGTVSPTYDANAKYVLFNGTSQYFTLPNGSLPFGNTPYSIFVVSYTRNAANPQWVIAGGNESSNQAIGLLYYTTNAVWHSWWVNEYRVDNSITNNVPAIINISYSTNRSILVNGGTASINNPAATRNNPNTPNYIGRRPGTASEYFNGGMGECIIYNSEISTSQRQQVEGYLAWKWGMVASLPAGHPYKVPPIAPFPLQVRQAVQNKWLPSNLSGLTLWLDAALQSSLTLSGSTITQWTDRSANIVFTSAGSPTYTTGAQNKQNVVTMNGTSQYFSSSFTINSATHTLIAVHKPTAVSTSRRLFAFQNSGLPYIVFPYTTSPTLRGYITSYDATTIDYINSPLADNSVTTNYNMIMATIQSNQQVVYLNGTQQASTAVALSSSTSSAMYIGTYYNAGTPSEYYGGNIGEMIAYNSFLTTSQRQQIEGYLAWKWGLVNTLPANHPYRLFPPS